MWPSSWLFSNIMIVSLCWALIRLEACMDSTEGMKPVVVKVLGD